MKTLSVLVCILLGLVCEVVCAAEAEQANITPASAIGTYKGRLTFNKGGKLKDYDFTINIVQIDQKNEKVWVTASTDFYRNKVLTHKNCQLLTDKPAISFVCKGENWHEDYVLSGDHIKANCTSIKNDPYFISATKVK